MPSDGEQAPKKSPSVASPHKLQANRAKTQAEFVKDPSPWNARSITFRERALAPVASSPEPL
jgi:hypothetical protein